MKFIDKIMDALSLYDEEELDEELDLKKPLPQEKDREKTALFKRKTPAAGRPENAGEPAAAPREKRPLFSFKNPQGSPPAEEGKMGSRTLSLPVANKLVNVVVLEPAGFDDSQKIADYLRGSQPVVVNFQNTDNVVAKRMTDFISGTIYALGGSMKKLGRNILVCAPKNVDIDAGEEMYDEGGEQPWKK